MTSFSRLVSPVLQLVVRSVEGERLHHVGPGAEELAVEAKDWRQSRVFFCKNASHDKVGLGYLHAIFWKRFSVSTAFFPLEKEREKISYTFFHGTLFCNQWTISSILGNGGKRQHVSIVFYVYLHPGFPRPPLASTARPWRIPSSPGRTRTRRRRSRGPRPDAPKDPMKLISDHIFAWEMFKFSEWCGQKTRNNAFSDGGKTAVLTNKEAENKKKNVHVRGGCNFHFTAAKL